MTVRETYSGRKPCPLSGRCSIRLVFRDPDPGFELRQGFRTNHEFGPGIESVGIGFGFDRCVNRTRHVAKTSFQDVEQRATDSASFTASLPASFTASLPASFTASFTDGFTSSFTDGFTASHRFDFDSHEDRHLRFLRSLFHGFAELQFEIMRQAHQPVDEANLRSVFFAPDRCAGEARSFSNRGPCPPGR